MRSNFFVHLFLWYSVHGQYLISIVAPTLSDDTPSGRETGSDGVIVHCSSGGLSGYHAQSLVTIQNTAPTTPSIDGESQGKVKVAYNYTFVTADPGGDTVYYFINWSDGSPEEPIGPFASSQEIIVSPSWTKKGTYVIKAKAMDIYGAESDWGTLEVTMPTDKQSTHLWLFSLFQRFPHAFPLLRNLLISSTITSSFLLIIVIFEQRNKY